MILIVHWSCRGSLSFSNKFTTKFSIVSNKLYFELTDKSSDLRALFQISSTWIISWRHLIAVALTKLSPSQVDIFTTRVGNSESISTFCSDGNSKQKQQLVSGMRLTEITSVLNPTRYANFKNDSYLAIRVCTACPLE
jgi:hypothetical protein